MSRKLRTAIKRKEVVEMEQELGRIRKSEHIRDVVIRSKKNKNGESVVSIIEYHESAKFTGFTSNEVEIPISRWAYFVELANKIKL